MGRVTYPKDTASCGTCLLQGQERHDVKLRGCRQGLCMRKWHFLGQGGRWEGRAGRKEHQSPQAHRADRCVWLGLRGTTGLPVLALVPGQDLAGAPRPAELSTQLADFP